MADVGWGELIAAGGTVTAGVWAIVKAIVSPHVKTVEEHGKQIKALEDKSAEYVTRNDLEKTETTVINALNTSIDRVAKQIGERIDTMDRAREAQIAQVAEMARTATRRLDEAQADEIRRLRQAAVK